MTKASSAWFLGLGAVGTLAALLGGGLVWLLVTRPVTLAMLLAGGLS